MQLNLGVTQSHVKPVTCPLHVRQHQVLARIVSDVVVSINMRHNGGSLILPDLATLGVVPVIVAVEQVFDRSTGHLPHLLQHGLRVASAHGVHHHDTITGHHKHGDVVTSGGEGIDTRCHLPGRRSPVLSLDHFVALHKMEQNTSQK